ncbi:MAG: LB_289 family protein [Nannocystaceae bacterium]
MKRNDLDKLNRDLKRKNKQARLHTKRINGAGTVKTYAQELLGILEYDSSAIYNTSEDEEVLELMMGMRDDLPEDQWDLVIRKAVRMTKVKQSDEAYESLREALDALAA